MKRAVLDRTLIYFSVMFCGIIMMPCDVFALSGWTWGNCGGCSPSGTKVGIEGHIESSTASYYYSKVGDDTRTYSRTDRWCLMLSPGEEVAVEYTIADKKNSDFICLWLVRKMPKVCINTIVGPDVTLSALKEKSKYCSTATRYTVRCIDKYYTGVADAWLYEITVEGGRTFRVNAYAGELFMAICSSQGGTGGEVHSYVAYSGRVTRTREADYDSYMSSSSGSTIVSSGTGGGSKVITTEPGKCVIYGPDKLYEGETGKYECHLELNGTSKVVSPNWKISGYGADFVSLSSAGVLTVKDIGLKYNPMVTAEYAGILVGKTVDIVPLYDIKYCRGAYGVGTEEAFKFKFDAVEKTITLNGAMFIREGYSQIGWAAKDGGELYRELHGSHTVNGSITFYPVWLENGVSRDAPKIPDVPSGLTYSGNCLKWSTALKASYYKVYRSENPFSAPSAYSSTWLTKAELSGIEFPSDETKVYFYFVKAYSAKDEATGSAFSAPYAATKGAYSEVHLQGPGKFSTYLIAKETIDGYTTSYKNMKFTVLDGSSSDISAKIAIGTKFPVDISSITSFGAYSGNSLVSYGTFSFSVSGTANNSENPRQYGFESKFDFPVVSSGQFKIGGKVITTRDEYSKYCILAHPHHYYQAGHPKFGMATTSTTVDAEGGTYSFPIYAWPVTNTIWRATPNDSWITLYRRQSVGNGCLGYVVEKNRTGVERVGTISVTSPHVSGTKTYTITQPALPVPATFSISYYPGTEGLGAPQTEKKTAGTTKTLKGGVFTRAGYVQTGWSLSENGTEAYRLAASYDIDSDLELYPVWSKISYIVSFDANGGSGAGNSVSVSYGSAMPTAGPLPTRSKYSFAGYFDAAVGGSQYYTAQMKSDRVWDKFKNTTLYAHWTLLAENYPDFVFDTPAGSGLRLYVCVTNKASESVSVFAKGRKDMGFSCRYTDANACGIVEGAPVVRFEILSASGTVLYSSEKVGCGRDAQWLGSRWAELSDLAIGTYQLRATLNSDSSVPESDFSNNICTYDFVVRDAQEDAYSYYLDGVGNVNLSGYDGVGGDLDLPSDFARIEAGTFSENADINSVTIPEGVTEIGAYAFSNCKGLTNVVISSTVTNIGAGAFAGDVLLKTISLPKELSVLDDWAFYGCSNLVRVYYAGNAPLAFGKSIYGETPVRLKSCVPHGSKGWAESSSFILPSVWPVDDDFARKICFIGEEGAGDLSCNITLRPGWNWLSLPLDTTDASPSAVFDGVRFDDNDIIKGGDESGQVVYSCGKWNGSLERMKPGACYLVYRASSSTVTATVEGEEPNGTIAVKSGWNMIGTLGAKAVPRESLTHSGGFATDDIIKTDGSAQMTYTDGKWNGTLKFLVPGSGYKMYFKNEGNLSFK